MVMLPYRRMLKSVTMVTIFILIALNLGVGVVDSTHPLKAIDLVELSLIIFLIYYSETRVTQFITIRFLNNLKLLEMTNKNILEYNLVKKNLLFLLDLSITLFVGFSQITILLIVSLYT